jgi:hypothetical protein
MKHLCPVCGYRDLPRPAREDLICPCCGTHFGYHDYATGHAELRRRWIADGAHWFSRAQAAPPGWDAETQLSEAGLIPYEVTGTTEESRIDFPADSPADSSNSWTSWTLTGNPNAMAA